MRFLILYFLATAVVQAGNSNYLDKFRVKQLHTPICNYYIKEDLNIDGISLLDFLDFKNKTIGIYIFKIEPLNYDRREPILKSTNSSIIKEINFISGEATTINGQKIYFDLDKCHPKVDNDVYNPNLVDYIQFIDKKDNIDLWNYYVIANYLTEFAKKNKLTPFDLVEMHPYKTRNLSSEQKADLKIKLRNIETQLPKIYYSYSNSDIEKKIIFNEVVKKYNNAYNRLK